MCQLTTPMPWQPMKYDFLVHVNICATVTSFDASSQQCMLFSGICEWISGRKDWSTCERSANPWRRQPRRSPTGKFAWLCFYILKKPNSGCRKINSI